MKKQILIIILFLTFLMDLSANIEIINFVGESYISKGERTVLKWEYKNAEKVILKDTDFEFNTTDSLILHPNSNTKYGFLAVSEYDTLLCEWLIVIGEKSDSIEVKQPINININSKEQPSTLSTGSFKYFNGQVIIPEEAVKPLTTKIIAIKNIQSNVNTFEIDAIVIDDNGNFVSNLYSNDFSNFSYSIECDNISHTGLINRIDEINSENELTPYNFIVCVDNSIFAENSTPEIIENINSFSQGIHLGSDISLTLFNHNIIYQSDVFYNNNASKIFSDLEIPNSSGLSAIYRSVSNSIASFQNPNKQNICIIITSGKDNSSLTFDVNDLVEIANSNNTKIFTIGIGNNIEPYILKYISTQTGGNYYYVEDNNLYDLLGIFNEIQFSSSNYYKLNFVYDDNMQFICDKSIIELTLDYYSKSTKDRTEYSFISMPLFSIYQALAAYIGDNTELDAEYENNIRLIGDILIDNPEVAIQIIGNTYKYANSQQIALDRAINIYKALKNYGVNPVQLRFKSNSNTKPLYYVASLDWQNYLNNRVEIKWLAPSLYPYEIIAKTFNSEEEAFNRVLEWETIGYDAYYERFYDNYRPQYRIKLWGFKTEGDANQAINILKADFNYEFVLD